MYCERCGKPTGPILLIVRELICEACDVTRSERAWESYCSDFGGDLPFTASEQYQAAAREKRELDR